jgi:hypothetical protein
MRKPRRNHSAAFKARVALEVALMVAVLPGVALDATVSRPLALMPATLGAEDWKVSPAAVKDCVVPSL